MGNKIVNKGLKIDFHIHSVYSSHVLGDKDKVKNCTSDDTRISFLLNKLNSAGVNLASITDHNNFNYDIYHKINEKINQRVASGESISIIKFFPGIEFSIDINNKVVHIVTLFNDSDQNKIKQIENILSKLQIKEQTKIVFDKYVEFLTECDLDTILIAHQKTNVKYKDKNNFSSISEKDQDKLLFLDFFDAFEYKNICHEQLFARITQTNDKYKDTTFIIGSDCHDWDSYPSNREQGFTYLKCLPTFKGLKLSITSPSRIRTIDNFFTTQSQSCLDKISLKIKEQEITIPLSKGINAIIGDNSSGKSFIMNRLISDDVPARYEINEKIEKGYKLFENNFNIKFISQIQKNQLFEYDYQGAIKNLFLDDKQDSKTYLSGLYPNKPDYNSYITLMNKKIDEFCDYLKTRIDIDKKVDNLGELVVPREIKSDFLFFELISDNVDSTIKLYDDALNEVSLQIINLKKLLEDKYQNIFNQNDRDTINTFIDFLTKKQDLISEHLKVNKYKKMLWAIINKNIQDAQNQLDLQRTSIQKESALYMEYKASFIKTISQVIKSNSTLLHADVNIEEQKVAISEARYGKYRFVYKCNLSKINNQYLYNLICSQLTKEYKKNHPFFINGSIDLQRIDNLNKFLDSFKRQKFKEANKIIEDFSRNVKEENFKNFEIKSAIFISENGQSTELSCGLNAKLYFEIISQVHNHQGIYLVDQPEDDISQSSINEHILGYFKNIAENRQIILITHNPQLVVNLDVDNVIHIKRDKNGFNIISGALEYEDKEKDINILKTVAENLDGGFKAIQERYKKYYGKRDYL